MSNEQKQKLKDYRKEYYKKYYTEKKLNYKKQHILMINVCIGAFYFNVKVWLLPGWLLLIFSLKKTPLGETGCLSNPYFLLTGGSGIQFF